MGVLPSTTTRSIHAGSGSRTTPPDTPHSTHKVPIQPCQGISATKQLVLKNPHASLLCMPRIQAAWLIAPIMTTGMLAQLAYAQPDTHDLEQALKGKQLHLRSYSADSTAHYTWTNGALVAEPPQLSTFGIFIPASVKLKGHVLTIAGDEATLARDAKTNNVGMAGHSKMSLVIDLGPANPADVLPQLQGQLFFPDGTSAHAGLPHSVLEQVPYSSVGRPQPSGCNCTHVIRDGQPIEVPLHDPDFTQVRVTGMADPEYTPEARSANIKGTVLLTFLVNTKGQATDIWVLRSLGFGLDQAAANAARKYRFAPASYRQQPVEMQLSIEVNFQFF